MDNEDAIKRLPGDLKRVAELIGLEPTLTLVRHFGGGYLVIPKCEAILREIRDNEIRRDYDLGTTSIRELAWRYLLTDRTIKTILSKTTEEVPLPLFALQREM